MQSSVRRQASADGPAETPHARKKSVSNPLIVFSSGYSYKGCNEAALALFPFLSDIGIDENIRTKLLQSQKQALESRVETLYDISHKDEMTGLFNRRYYESVIAELRERESIENIVVAEMDLNGLKAANDNIGHKAGDELIVAAANILTQVFGPCGKVFRTGGDEFFVIAESPDKDIPAIEKKLNNSVEKWRGSLVDRLSLSYGIIRAKDHPDKNIDELMIAADQAMYQCKAAYYTASGNDRRHSNR